MDDKSAVLTAGGKVKRTASTLRVYDTEDELAYRDNEKQLIKFDGMLKCTKCLTDVTTSIEKGVNVTHPLLGVFFCKKCSDFYNDGDFSLDEDDDEKYCRWCGEGGILFLCSKCVCGFCPACIKKNFGKKVCNNIKQDDNWNCFICEPKPLWRLRYVTSAAINNVKKAKRDQRKRKLESLKERAESENQSKTARIKRKSRIRLISDKSSSNDGLSVDADEVKDRSDTQNVDLKSLSTAADRSATSDDFKELSDEKENESTAAERSAISDDSQELNDLKKGKTAADKSATSDDSKELNNQKNESATADRSSISDITLNNSIWPSQVLSIDCDNRDQNIAKNVVTKTTSPAGRSANSDGTLNNSTCSSQVSQCHLGDNNGELTTALQACSEIANLIDKFSTRTLEKVLKKPHSNVGTEVKNFCEQIKPQVIELIGVMREMANGTTQHED